MFRYATLLITLGCLSLCAMLRSENAGMREELAAGEEQSALYQQSLRALTVHSRLERNERVTPWFYGITGMLCLLTILLFRRPREEKDAAP